MHCVLGKKKERKVFEFTDYFFQIPDKQDHVWTEGKDESQSSYFKTAMIVNHPKNLGPKNHQFLERAMIAKIENHLFFLKAGPAFTVNPVKRYAGHKDGVWEVKHFVV